MSVPLNERGRDEASAAGREFKAQQIRFDKVIVSGLPRTIETAQRVLAETGQADRNRYLAGMGRDPRRHA